MKTLYVDSLLLTSLRPIMAGIWPTPIEMAAPVMKEVMATKGINSTIQPSLVRPMKSKNPPAMRERALAIVGAEISGSFAWTLVTMLPTMVDMTATVWSHVSFYSAIDELAQSRWLGCIYLLLS